MTSILNFIVSLLPKPIADYLKQDNLYNREILYSSIFRDTIEESEWLQSKNFSLNAGASNYSFMYMLYRILDECRPENILELGLGQTTKLTSQYVNFFKNSSLITIESDSDWIEVFSQKLILTDNIQIIKKDVETFTYKNTENLRYKDFTEGISDKKFDLIVIDGPNGFFPETSKFLDYSRSNILELIPNNLSEDFIIIIDDYERKGEQNTVNEVKELLNKVGYEFYEVTSFGLKQQHIIISEKFKFVIWY